MTGCHPAARSSGRPNTITSKRSNGTSPERDARAHSARGGPPGCRRTVPLAPFSAPRSGCASVRPTIVNRAAGDCLVEARLGLRKRGSSIRSGGTSLGSSRSTARARAYLARLRGVGCGDWRYLHERADTTGGLRRPL